LNRDPKEGLDPGEGELSIPLTWDFYLNQFMKALMIFAFIVTFNSPYLGFLLESRVELSGELLEQFDFQFPLLGIFT